MGDASHPSPCPGLSLWCGEGAIVDTRFELDVPGLVRQVRRLTKHWIGLALEQRQRPSAEQRHIDVAFAAEIVVGSISVLKVVDGEGVPKTVRDSERVLDWFPLASVTSGADACKAVSERWVERLGRESELPSPLLEELVLDVFEILPPFDRLATYALVEELNPSGVADVVDPVKPKAAGGTRRLLKLSPDAFRRRVQSRIPPDDGRR